LHQQEDIKTLVKSLGKGDEIAFTQLYKLFEARIYRYVVSSVKSPELSDDITQEVFVKLWESREALDPEQSFQAFLFTIARNQILNLFRKLKTDETLRAQIFSFAQRQSNYTEEIINFNETEDLIQLALDKLPPRQRQIFELCKIKGLSHQEVADQLAISEGTVNVQLVKSVKFLRKFLSPNASFATTFSILMSYLDSH